MCVSFILKKKTESDYFAQCHTSGYLLDTTECTRMVFSCTYSLLSILHCSQNQNRFQMETDKISWKKLYTANSTTYKILISNSWQEHFVIELTKMYRPYKQFYDYISIVEWQNLSLYLPYETPLRLRIKT